jgi:hypothetical protein
MLIHLSRPLRFKSQRQILQLCKRGKSVKNFVVPFISTLNTYLQALKIGTRITKLGDESAVEETAVEVLPFFRVVVGSETDLGFFA